MSLTSLYNTATVTNISVQHSYCFTVQWMFGRSLLRF